MSVPYMFNESGAIHTTEHATFREAIYQAERDYFTGRAQPLRIRDEYGNVFGPIEIDGYVKHVIPLWREKERLGIYEQT